jgi:hypothetical protein
VVSHLAIVFIYVVDGAFLYTIQPRTSYQAIKGTYREDRPVDCEQNTNPRQHLSSDMSSTMHSERSPQKVVLRRRQVPEAVTARVLRFTYETGAQGIELAMEMPKKSWRKVREDVKADGNCMMTGG